MRLTVTWWQVWGTSFPRREIKAWGNMLAQMKDWSAFFEVRFHCNPSKTYLIFFHNEIFSSLSRTMTSLKQVSRLTVDQEHLCDCRVVIVTGSTHIARWSADSSIDLPFVSQSLCDWPYTLFKTPTSRHDSCSLVHANFLCLHVKKSLRKDEFVWEKLASQCRVCSAYYAVRVKTSH